MEKLMKTIVTVCSFTAILLLCSVKADAAIINPTPVAEYSGENSGDQFGSVVFFPGDINSDGYEDLFVGANEYDSGGATGRGYVFYGGVNALNNKSASLADVILTGEVTEDQFGGHPGFSYSSLGDINGDGYNDLVVSSIGWLSGSVHVGRVYIFYGSSNGIASKNASSADTILTGDGGIKEFAQSTAIGDLNRDGYDDLVAGSSRYNTHQGRVYVFYGSSNGISSKFSSSADAIIDGEVGADSSLDEPAVGDFNGDGYEDIILSAPHYQGYLAGNTYNGKTYVFYGGSSKLSSQNVASADVIFTGEENSMIGLGLASMGDLNKDGYDDIIFGSLMKKRAYVYYGGTSLSSTSVTDQNADIVFSGLSDDYVFGASVFGSSAGITEDLNNDGYLDFIITDMNLARVYVFFYSPSMLSRTDVDADITFVGNQSTSTFYGFVIPRVLDLNNDGWKEIVISEPYYPSSLDARGRALVYSLDYASAELAADSIGDLTASETSVTGTVSVTGVNIGGVEIRLDGGEWMTCNAADGAFDEPEEEFICPLSGLSSGGHTAEVRFYDENMIYIPSSMYASETFNVVLPRTGEKVSWIVIGGLMLLIVGNVNVCRKIKYIKNN